MEIIDTVSSRIYLSRSRMYYDKLLRQSLVFLRKRGMFVKHPLKQSGFAISKSAHHRTHDLLWQDYYYSISHIASENFIPPSVFYPIIEPVLNHRLMVSTLKDKNFYNLFFSNLNTPPTILRRINGFMYDCDYASCKLSDEYLWKKLENYDKIILKPSVDSGSGSGILLFIRNGKKIYCDGKQVDTSFLNSLRFDFVLQAYIEQHSFFHALNPSSNNTVRLLVYRSIKDDSVNVLHSLLKIGAPGAFMDHDNLGGVSISIDDQGLVGDSAFDVHGNKLRHFAGVTIGSIGIIPNYADYVKTAKQIAAKCYYGRLIGLDFTMDSHGRVVFLDLNCWRNGINHYQFCHGSLFRDFTNEVISFCNSADAVNILRIKISNSRSYK